MRKSTRLSESGYGGRCPRRRTSAEIAGGDRFCKKFPCDVFPNGILMPLLDPPSPLAGQMGFDTTPGCCGRISTHLGSGTPPVQATDFERTLPHVTPRHPHDRHRFAVRRLRLLLILRRLQSAPDLVQLQPGLSDRLCAAIFHSLRARRWLQQLRRGCCAVLTLRYPQELGCRCLPDGEPIDTRHWQSQWHPT